MKRVLAVWTLSAGLSLVVAGCGNYNTCTSQGFTLDSGSTMNIADATHTKSVAQSFAPTSSITVKTIALNLKQIGTIPASTSTLTLTVETDNGQSYPSYGPTGTAIANGTANSVDPSVIPTTKGQFTFTFLTPLLLSQGTTYWLRLKATYPALGTNYIQWSGYYGSSAVGHATYETSGGGTFDASGVGISQALVFVPGC